MPEVLLLPSLREKTARCRKCHALVHLFSPSLCRTAPCLNGLEKEPTELSTEVSARGARQVRQSAHAQESKYGGGSRPMVPFLDRCTTHFGLF